MILPRLFTREAVKLLQKTSELSVAFLDDCMEGALARSVTRRIDTETAKTRRGKEKRRLIANPGDVIVH